MSALLDIDHLHTRFTTDAGPIDAVNDVSFKLAEGETLGIVGESGSGKSALGLSLLRLLPEPAGKIVGGKILFQQYDLLALDRTELRKLRGNRIAMIFQDPMTSLNPFLTIERQLSEVLEVHENISHQKACARSVEMLERVGIPDAPARIKQYPHQFSGGMRQRVMIAMALLCRPALLIADEPTTALDVTIQIQILDLLSDLQRDMGTAIILISHDLTVVRGYTDRVAIMYAGRFVETGPTRTVLSSPEHPYTYGLLHSVPDLTHTSTTLTPIMGAPPHLGSLPSGCAFAARCPRQAPACIASLPALVGPHPRQVRCIDPIQSGTTP